MRIGANFCQVSRKKKDDSLRGCMTGGNQKWKGVAPSFRHKPSKMKRRSKTDFSERKAASNKVIDATL